MRNRGQAAGAALGIILVGMFAAVIYYNLTDTVVSNAYDGAVAMESGTVATLDSTFDDNTMANWTVTDVDNAVTTHDSVNDWVDVKCNAAATGTSTITQDLEVPQIVTQATSATLTARWQIADNTHLVRENVRLKLVDPSGNTDTIYENIALTDPVAWVTVENDVASYIDEEGTYQIILEVELETAVGTTYEHNWDTASLTVNQDGLDDTGGGALIRLSGGVLWAIVGIAVVIGIVIMVLSKAGIRLS